jgi:MFS family permease
MQADATEVQPTLVEEPYVRPTATLPIGHLIRISLYWLGLTAIDGAVGLFIQNRVNFGAFAADPLEVGRILFLLSIPVAVISILIQPTVGSISDYTVSRWGRRKPYIVIGSVLDVVFLAGIALSSSILMLGAFAALLAVSTNIARGPFQGYVPDLVPEKQVGLASAMVGLMQILGNVTGFVLVTVAVLLGRIEVAIFAVAIVELVTMVAVVARVGEGQPPKPRNGKSWGTIAREVWGTDVLKERSYVWLLTSRFFFLMGGAVLVNLIITYLKQTHGLSEDASNSTNLVMLVTIVVANVLAIIPSAIVGGALFGASAGTFLAVDWALMTDIIPKASSGRYMGLSNVATTSSTVIAVATGGLLLDAVNIGFGLGAGPRAAYLLGAAYYVVAALTLRPVVEPPRSERRATGIPMG